MWKNRIDLSRIAGWAALILVSVVLLVLIWFICVTFAVGRHHFGLGA
jgi:hypothetical protein